jgi:hypothetical protein
MVKWTKCPWNIPSSSIATPSKIYPNIDFWFENKPSGNPGANPNFKHIIYFKVHCIPISERQQLEVKTRTDFFAISELKLKHSHNSCINQRLSESLPRPLFSLCSKTLIWKVSDLKPKTFRRRVFSSFDFLAKKNCQFSVPAWLALNRRRK